MSGLELEAARWYARLAHAEADHADRGRFEAWLAASPRHVEEYARFDATWRDFDTGDGLHRLACGIATRADQKRRSRRRLLTGGAVGMAALGAAGLTAWKVPRLARPTGVDDGPILLSLRRRSGRRDLLEQRLSDGSVATLAPATALEVVFRAHRREAVLASGEAVFDVARDPARPFVVRAAGTRAEVLGTTFVVSHLGTDVRLSVLDGRVRFGGGTGSTMLLGAGEVAQWSSSDRPEIGPRRLSRRAADATSWRTGTLVFEADSLAEVSAQVQRFADLELDVAAVRDRAARVTAVVQLRDVHAFVRGLPLLAPVRVTPVPGGGYRVTPR